MAKQRFFRLVPVIFIAAMKSTKLIAAMKMMKFSKPLITIISMLISVIFYGIWLGPWFGVGLVAMLFIHEIGHIIALRMKGYETHGPVFIPFLGAAIFAPAFEDRNAEAFVGFGGPLLGTIAALACFGAWYITGQTSEILLLVSYAGVFLNLFNLIPISPLDGGRVTQVVGGWFKLVGVGLLLAYTLTVRQPSLLLIWILLLDGFSLRLWLKPLLGGIFAASMIFLMALGYSGQPWYIDIADCSFATFLITVFVYRDYNCFKSGEVLETDARTYPRVMTRMKWLACYLGLAFLTSFGILVEAEYLPNAVKASAQLQ